MTPRSALGLVALLILTGWLSPPAFAAPLEGGLEPLRGATGCVTDTGSPKGCADGRGLRGPASVAISPDGRHVYVAAVGPTIFSTGSIAVFARDPRTGVRQLSGRGGCISERGTDGCSSLRTPIHPLSIVASPDGRHIYVASSAGDPVSIFSRDRATGELTQARGPDGCVGDGGAGGCTPARGLRAGEDVAISADGRHVYVTSSDGLISIFARDPVSGRLMQASGPGGCVTRLWPFIVRRLPMRAGPG